MPIFSSKKQVSTEPIKIENFLIDHATIVLITIIIIIILSLLALDQNRNLKSSDQLYAWANVIYAVVPQLTFTLTLVP